MSPWVALPSPREARRAAALEELRGTLEAIRGCVRLAARGGPGERELRLLIAIDLAAARAQQAVRRLDA